jgi:predicted amidohydrolase YtcJ
MSTRSQSALVRFVPVAAAAAGTVFVMTDVRVFSGGTILTMDGAHPRAEALAVDGDRIVAVGDAAAVRAAAAAAEEIDLAGGCLLPGFIDAHHHFSEGALLTSQLDLHWPAVDSVADVLERLRERARDLPKGEWVVAEGYDERRLRERRAPTLDELDRVCSDHPVLLVQFSYHEVTVNSRAHEVTGTRMDRPDPPGGQVERDRSGRPTGRMIENAAAPFYMNGVRALLERDEAGYFDCLERYQQRLFRTGITRLYDPAVSPIMEQTLRRAVDRGVLRLPITIMLSSANGMFVPPRDRLDGARTGDGSDLLRVGPLKMFMDGGIRCAMRLSLSTLAGVAMTSIGRAISRRSLDPWRAAQMSPLRYDREDRRVRAGILFYTEQEARALVEDATTRGLSIAVHAEGNEAIDRTLRVLPRDRERPPGVPPHRIEHFFLPDPDAIPRAAELGIAIATQPTIAEWTGDQVLDMGLIGRQPFVPLRSLFDAGLTVAGSSDAPVVDFDPLKGIRRAVDRRTAGGECLDDGQEITAGEALAMYTTHAARSGGLEHEVGTLAVGKRADLVVLDRDPTSGRADDLEHATVIRTVVGGADVYCAAG